jgi:alkylhydroperoxidase family enzyme
MDCTEQVASLMQVVPCGKPASVGGARVSPSTRRPRWQMTSLMTLRRLALAVGIGLLGCAHARTPSGTSNPVPAPVTAAARAERSCGAEVDGASIAFRALRDRVLDGLLADDPALARDLGLHEYDGRVASLSRDAIASRTARLRAASDELAAVPPNALDDDESLDLAELVHWVQTRLFWLADMDAPRKYPAFYEDLFSVSVYVDRDYAPFEVRAGHLVAQEEAALAELSHARENLTVPLSKPLAEVAARNFAGFATYLRGDVTRWMSGTRQGETRRRFVEVNGALANAADDLSAWLRKESVRGDQSHVLGPERFAKLIRVQEGLSLSIDEFAQMNEENLAANRRAYEALAQAVRPEPATESTLFADAASLIEQSRRFVVDHGVVTLASQDAVTVRETPPYERWNFASIEMSGPFERAKSAFYQLTIPDRSWPATERQQYLGSKGDLLATTVHEVVPGHFVQGRWAERAPTRVQKAFSDYAFVEGWAHYVEQMMIEEGFGRDDPANRLAMLGRALLRNCRYAASVGIHVNGMTIEDAEKRFIADCHQDRATAHEQAMRASFDPGYFAYTLGKLQILQIREEARAKLGGRFSLQRFHDALLSHGSPPLALIAARVLRDLGDKPGSSPETIGAP